LRRTYGADAARVHRIYNGLDLDQFPYESPEHRPARIVTVGRLVEKKGVADLVEACAVLHGRAVAFHCDIVGTGPLEPELRDLIRRLGLEERVRLLGPRPRSEVIAHVRRAAVFADGDRDGLPTVLVEAMALGTPCVSTDVTGIPELLRPDDGGLIVPQHDPRALATALERLLADPALRVRLATRARRRVEAEFDIRRTTARLRAIFGQAGAAAAATAPLRRVAF
jgi:colanic acid/amylovoran biosynthesis glycosyltransferase